MAIGRSVGTAAVATNVPPPAPEHQSQQASRAPEPGQQGMPPVDMTRVNYYTGHRVYEMYEDNFMTLLFLIVRGA